MRRSILLFLIVSSLVWSCKQSTSNMQTPAVIAGAKNKVNPVEARSLSEEFKAYWYKGEAELTSYALQQARYGNLNEGHAVLVFVTEPFNPQEQVKADRPSDDNQSVLKLNATKKFLTGIYPYSIMTSTFLPVGEKKHALKVTNSVQEWCGHVFSQLNNREKFEISSYSYFESEGDQELKLEKTILEDEFWGMIRLAPDELPEGEFDILPSFEYLRLKHKPIRSYKASAAKKIDGALTIYTLSFPELDRTLSISFSTAFPHTIESWEESAPDGFGANASVLKTTAKRIERVKLPYWRLNGPEDVALRNELGI